MTSSNKSSGSSGGNGGSTYYMTNEKVAPAPIAPSAAPKGANLGTQANGGTLISNGDGTATNSKTGQAVSLGDSNSSAGSIIGGSVDNSNPRSLGDLNSSRDSGGGYTDGTPQPVATSVTGADTTQTSDYSIALAGQTGLKKSKAPNLSNNFISIVGGAGGLGRKATNSKRTLIGGA